MGWTEGWTVQPQRQRCTACSGPQSAAAGGQPQGLPGRVWSPLRVRCKGVALRGAPPPAAWLKALPPIAPCHCLGAPKCARAVPLRASPDTIVRRGPGEGGGRARPFCWVLGSWTPLLMAAHGEPALPFQDAHRLPSYGDFTSKVHACGRGVAFAPLASLAGLGIARAGRLHWVCRLS